jgi:hypothetical protein
MDPKVVERLEAHLQDVVTRVIMGMGLKRLPLLPTRQTTQSMAKAAVSVYEAAVENDSHGS